METTNQNENVLYVPLLIYSCSCILLSPKPGVPRKLVISPLAGSILLAALGKVYESFLQLQSYVLQSGAAAAFTEVQEAASFGAGSAVGALHC